MTEPTIETDQGVCLKLYKESRRQESYPAILCIANICDVAPKAIHNIARFRFRQQEPAYTFSLSDDLATAAHLSLSTVKENDE
ncbi:hypothetical protein HBH95_018200 [Parastagonospora nodorum]|nr:hypothetical protein HBH95_018200 [Parastagonospora nodorum]